MKTLPYLLLATLASLHSINLSPFTKDFRVEEHYNESITIFRPRLGEDINNQYALLK